jgi:gliding motility-associated-like protein
MIQHLFHHHPISLLKMKPISNLLAAGLLLIASQVFGQLTTSFSPSNLPNVAVGGNVSLQLKVNNFTNISSLQLPICYDKAILHFDSIDNPIMPGYGDTTVASHPTAGKIIVSWFPSPSQYPNGVTIPANTAIFTLRFTVLSAGTASVNVCSSSPGIEVYNNVGTLISVTYASGGSSVTGTGTTPPPPPVSCNGTGNPPAAPTYTGFKMIANKLYVPPGEHACVPITVNKFNLVTLMQYAFHWDPAVLQFDCTRNYNLTGLDAGSFNTITPGTQLLVWFDPSVAGITRPDGARLYEICFKGIGAPGATSKLWFDGVGFPPGSGGVEVDDPNGNNIWTNTTPVNDTAFVVNPSSPGCPIYYTVDKNTVDANSNTCVNVKVSKFFWATSAEFNLTYDPAMLTYQSINLGANPLNLTTSGTANFTQTAGNVKFTWANFTPANGTTLADSTAIFAVCFQSTGAANSIDNINISSVNNCPTGVTALQSLRKNMGIVPTVVAGGYVKVKSGPTCSATATATSPACPGATGSLNVTGGGAGCTASVYSWAGPGGFTSALQSPTGITTAGIYTVTVTFGSNGTVTSTATITIPTPSVTASSTNPPCATAKGTLTATPAPAGCTPSSYSWKGPNGYTSSVQNPTDAPVDGVYTVTVTYSGGATATASTSITFPQPILLLAAQINPTGVTCFGGSDGGVTIAPSGGVPGYTYAWKGPAGTPYSTQNLTNIPAGGYVVTVTDSKGCSAVSPSIVIPTPPQLNLNTGNVAISPVKCFGGNDGSISLSAAVSGGTQPYNATWNGPNGVVGPGLTVSSLTAGNYNLTISDAKGCSMVHSSPLVVTGASSAVNVTLGTVTNVKCINDSNGSITVNATGGTGAYTYTWKNNQGVVVTPTNLQAGSYTVTASDANNCTKTLTATVQKPSSALTAQMTSTIPVVCPGDNNGLICVGVNGGWAGTPTFVWSSNNSTTPAPVACPNNLPGGTYTATITDPGGCTVTITSTVVSPPDIVINSTPVVNNVSCFGVGDGSININPISGGNGGAFTVTWTNTSLSGPNISGLSGGTYIPTVRDANGCSKTFSNIPPVTEPQALTQSASVTDQQSPSQLGSVILTASGGTTPYSYLWNTGATSKDLTSLVKNNYTVTVTDAHGCSSIQSYSVKYPNVLPTWWYAVTKSCGSDGKITIHIPAGAPAPYLIKWSTGQLPTSDTLVTLTQLTAGTYDLTITDFGGNSDTKTVKVDQLEQATLHNVDIGNSFTSQSTGSIVLTPDNPFDTYLWNYKNKTSSALIGIDSGTYCVTVTAPSTCTAVYCYHVSRYYPLFVVPQGVSNNPKCLTNQNGTITIPDPISGGNPPYKFKWAGPGGFTATTQNLTGLSGGTYTVTVSDQNDTTRIQTFTLAPQSLLAISGVTITTNFGGTPVSGANSCDGGATVAYGGQTGIVSIEWSNGVQGSASNTTLCAGPYSVTVSDANGCSSTISGTLAAPSAILISAQVDSLISCHGKCDGKASAIIKGGVPPYTVHWSNGNIDQLATSGSISRVVNLCGDTYSVTVTDHNGITQVIPVDVNDPDPIGLALDIQQLPASFNACDGVVKAVAPGAVLPATYTWAGNKGTDHKGNTDLAVNLCANELVTFYVTDAHGCSAIVSDTVPFPKTECLKVRPVITPGQQDGKNDFLFIPCIEQVANSIEIYNRWGQLVFQTTNYDNASNNWNGLTKTGQPLAAGVYYYVLTYTDDNGNQQQLKGYVNLLL